MNAQRFRQLTYAFAIGDALGSAFEFDSPSREEVSSRFNDSSELQFTDDTLLLLTTLSAMMNCSGQGGYSLSGFYAETCRALHQWFLSGDLRGAGDTTYQALKQIDNFAFEHQDFADFTLSERGYNKKWSAGNGALSRSLPLLASRLDLTGFPLKKWVQITHWHPDAVRSVELLHNYLKNHIVPPSLAREGMKGFYCLETLEISINAVEIAKNLHEAFLHSIVPEGDNDSIAALTFALWYLKHGYTEFSPLEPRVNHNDREKLDIELRKSFFAPHA